MKILYLFKTFLIMYIIKSLHGIYWWKQLRINYSDIMIFNIRITCILCLIKLLCLVLFAYYFEAIYVSTWYAIC